MSINDSHIRLPRRVVLVASFVASSPRRAPLTEIWECAPQWCRVYAILAFAWLLVALLVGGRAFLAQGRVPISEADPMSTMLGLALLNLFNALALIHFLAACKLGPEEHAPQKAVAHTPVVVVPGTPKAIMAALAISLVLVFSHEMADASLRLFGRPLVMSRSADHMRSCKNPECTTIGAPCFPGTYTLCETVAAKDGSVRYFRGLEVTTYRFKDGKPNGYHSIFFSSILAAVFVVVVIVIFTVSDRLGIEYKEFRFRLSNVPVAYIPIVCGYILAAAVFVFGIKMWLSETLPRLSAGMS